MNLWGYFRFGPQGFLTMYLWTLGWLWFSISSVKETVEVQENRDTAIHCENNWGILFPTMLRTDSTGV